MPVQGNGGRRRYTLPKTGDGWPSRADPSRGLDPGLTGPRAWSHPAAVAWRRDIAAKWAPASRVVIVTPCSNVKPYPRSPQSGKVRGVLRRLGLWDSRGPGYKGAPRGVDWVYLSDLLGLVPYEHAHEYPACCYEFPPQLLHSDPGMVEELVEAVRPPLERAAQHGAVILAYLPSRHRAILEEALRRAKPRPEAVWARYNLFRGHEDLAAKLRELIGR